ncbi:MAG: transposase [Rudaea sp.]
MPNYRRIWVPGGTYFFTVALLQRERNLHCVWRLPPGDADYATRWRHIKSLFSRSIESIETRSQRRVFKGERGIWQRRYWEHRIRDESDLAAHVDYVHFSPAKHGHVKRVRDWPHSTFHRYVRQGDLAQDWAEAPSSRDFGAPREPI